MGQELETPENQEPAAVTAVATAVAVAPPCSARTSMPGSGIAQPGISVPADLGRAAVFTGPGLPAE